MEVIFSPRAVEDLKFWKRSGNKVIQRKIQELITAIQEDPFSGIGKPRPFKRPRLRVGKCGCLPTLASKCRHLDGREVVNKVLFFLFLNILPACCFSQQVSFMFERKPLNAIDTIEINTGGTIFNYSYQISLSKNYMPGIDSFNLANTKVYRHDFVPFNVEVSYFFSLPDSTLRMVEYNWEGNYQKRENLNELFNTNIDLISKKFEDQHLLFKETNKRGDNWTGLCDEWETNTYYIKQFSVLGSGTYRVRLSIVWK